MCMQHNANVKDKLVKTRRHRSRHKQELHGFKIQ
jgi:hypothetical protein